MYYFLNRLYGQTLSCQLPGRAPFTGGNVTIFKGNRFWHIDVTDQIEVGNRILEVLNQPIASNFFANKIAANTHATQFGIDPLQYRPSSQNTVTNTTDSLIQYIDTVKIRILTPTYLSESKVDSLVTVKINLKDTITYRRTLLLFQGEQYSTTSKEDTLTFNLKINPSVLDTQTVMVAAIYDSLGFTIYHYGLTKIIVKPDSLCQQLIVSPATKLLNPGETYIPSINGIHPTYITSIGLNDPAISFSIADTNVIRYDNLQTRFIAKDTGYTFIEFSYRGKKDTLFVYITIPSNEAAVVKECPGQTIKYVADSIQDASYQWQVDMGNGFIDLSNSSSINGINTDTLILINIPTSNRGNKYRCVTTNGPVTTYTDTKILLFGITWLGGANNDWNNPANWQCNILPDENVDVIIPTGKQHYPTISSNTKVHSVVTKPGASVHINAGIILEIKGK